MAVEVTRKELTAAELRFAAAKSKDSRAARRMLAIALVLEGTNRTTAATTCGMDRQTLRDWVHRYNAEGLAGLANRHAPGASPLLTPEQKAELAALVEAGPDPQRDGVEGHRFKSCPRNQITTRYQTLERRPSGRRLRFQYPWKHCGNKRLRSPSKNSVSD